MPGDIGRADICLGSVGTTGNRGVLSRHRRRRTVPFGSHYRMRSRRDRRRRRPGGRILPAATGAATAACALSAIAPPLVDHHAGKTPASAGPYSRRRGDLVDHEPSPTIEGIGAVGAMTLPDAGTRTAGRTAGDYLTGILAGAALIVVVATLVSVSWHPPASAGPDSRHRRAGRSHLRGAVSARPVVTEVGHPAAILIGAAYHLARVLSR